MAWLSALKEKAGRQRLDILHTEYKLFQGSLRTSGICTRLSHKL